VRTFSERQTADSFLGEELGVSWVIEEKVSQQRGLCVSTTEGKNSEKQEWQTDILKTIHQRCLPGNWKQKLKSSLLKKKRNSIDQQQGRTGVESITPFPAWPSPPAHLALSPEAYLFSPLLLMASSFGNTDMV
jgi:hypothetical protein